MRLRHLVLAAVLACGFALGVTAAPAGALSLASATLERVAGEAPVEWTRRRGRRYRGYRGYRSGYRRGYRSYRYRSYRARRGSYTRRRATRGAESRREQRAPDEVQVRQEERRGPRPTFDYGGVRR